MNFIKNSIKFMTRLHNSDSYSYEYNYDPANIRGITKIPLSNNNYIRLISTICDPKIYIKTLTPIENLVVIYNGKTLDCESNEFTERSRINQKYFDHFFNKLHNDNTVMQLSYGITQIIKYLKLGFEIENAKQFMDSVELLIS